MDISAGSSTVCRFCEEVTGRYTCPRCNVYYCSVACYKSPYHSDCSEAFYKECVEEEMRSREPDPTIRKSMMDILLRNYEERDQEDESDDSDDETGLEDRLRGIDLDDAEQVWSNLTVEERKEFLEMAGTGDITKLVPLWDPWWSKRHRKPKVTFLTSDSTSELDYKSTCPEIKNNIPTIQTLSKSNPSPLVFNNLINVIASYVMSTRFLNGEQNDAPVEAASLLLDLSKNLSDNVTFDTLDLAIESVSTEAVNNQVIGASVENINQMKNDIVKICLGPNEDEQSFYVLAALSDLTNLLHVAIKSFKHNTLPQAKTVLPIVFEKKLQVNHNRKQLMMADKKLQYFLSWVVTCYTGIINEFKTSLPS